jgi:hypothetical protein
MGVLHPANATDQFCANVPHRTFREWLEERRRRLPDVYCQNRFCGAYLGMARFGEALDLFRCSLCQATTYIVSEDGARQPMKGRAHD